jgi:hypothetical protein
MAAGAAWHRLRECAKRTQDLPKWRLTSADEGPAAVTERTQRAVLRRGNLRNEPGGLAEMVGIRANEPTESAARRPDRANEARASAVERIALIGGIASSPAREAVARTGKTKPRFSGTKRRMDWRDSTGLWWRRSRRGPGAGSNAGRQGRQGSRRRRSGGVGTASMTRARGPVGRCGLTNPGRRVGKPAGREDRSCRGAIARRSRCRDATAPERSASLFPRGLVT